MATETIYLDYNATTPLHPRLKTFAVESLEKFGNASSIHWAGRDAKKTLHSAREQLAKYFGVQNSEIVFTSSGSEANNQAIKDSLPLVPKDGRREILISAVEHPSVMKAAQSLVDRGYVLRLIPVSLNGDLDLDFVEREVGPETALVSVMLVNNETGQIFPVKKVAKMAKAAGALMHSDMVQAFGKLSFQLQDLGVDLATFSGHKFYSLKGAGLLYVKSGTHLNPLIHGGGQERSRRAGTENILAISCLGKAVEILTPELNHESERILKLRDDMEREILHLYPHFSINGKGAPRVPHVSNVRCVGFDGETLLINLDVNGVAVSSGAACSSGSQEPSPVLRAMGLTHSEASESLRISLGWLTTEEEIKSFLRVFRMAVERMKCVGYSETLEGERDKLL